ncbi:AAA family ATPase [bacterium]|nr:AAA family ATPase [bacterium]
MRIKEGYELVVKEISKVLKGKNYAIRWSFAGLLTGGHILLEDLPGTGKTTLSKSFSKVIELSFKRIQCTSDLLPSDILGASIYDSGKGSFYFQEGPIFTDILLADEINRTSPRTQSALLESMEERQVTLEGKTHQLSQNFWVIATQNPIESAGTYPLPDAQLDRFALSFSLGYTNIEDELDILSDYQKGNPIDNLKKVISLSDLDEYKKEYQNIFVSDSIKKYIISIIRKTRETPSIILGASPRAGITIMKISQVLAAFDGVDYVTPEHIKEIVLAVLSHRIKIDPHLLYSGETTQKVINEILMDIPAP